MAVPQITLARCAPRRRIYHTPACVACRFHLQGGLCTYSGTCPAPACERCNSRPATLVVPILGGRVELCDDCAPADTTRREQAA